MLAPSSPETASRATAGAPIPAVDVALREAFAEHGPALLGDRALLERELVARFDEPPPDVALVLAAFDEQVPQALSSVEAIDDVAGMTRRLEKRLRERRGLNGYAAAWVVGAWSRAVAAAPDGVPRDRPRVDTLAPPLAADGTVPVRRDDGLATPDSGPARALESSTPPRPSDAAPRRRLVVGAAVGIAAALVVGIAFVAIDASHEDTPRGARRPSAATGPVDGPRATRVAAAAAAATARPLPRIVGVATSDPLPGDGRPHEVYVAFADGRGDVARIESRFVRGDGAWDAAPRSVEIGGDAVDRGTASAGPIALATARPAQVVFEYVAVTRDGGRSAPFSKTFDFVPVADCPANACGTVERSRVVGTAAAEDAYAMQVARALAIPIQATRERGRPSHEVTVRLDDHSTRVVRQADALPRGARVRLVDGRLVVASAGAAAERTTGAPSTDGERR